MPIPQFTYEGGKSPYGGYTAPKKTSPYAGYQYTPTPTIDYNKLLGRAVPEYSVAGASLPQIGRTPSVAQAPVAPQFQGGQAPQFQQGFMDLFKMLMGGMQGGMPQMQMPQYPDIQGMLKEAQEASYQQALTQKGIATTKIGEQAEETLKGISEIEDEEKRFAALDAASRGVYESGLLTQALAKMSEKYATGKTKVLTEKQSALDELEAALLGIKSASTMQALPMMQQEWQNKYAAATNIGQQKWQQQQSGFQNALNLYQMQLQDYWRRQSSGQTPYRIGEQNLINWAGGRTYEEIYGKPSAIENLYKYQV